MQNDYRDKEHYFLFTKLISESCLESNFNTDWLLALLLAVKLYCRTTKVSLVNIFQIIFVDNTMPIPDIKHHLIDSQILLCNVDEWLAYWRSTTFSACVEVNPRFVSQAIIGFINLSLSQYSIRLMRA